MSLPLLHRLAWLAAWLACANANATPAQAQAQATAPAPGPALQPTPDGAQVLDLRTTLVWPRCVEGMRWSGKTCVGEPLRLSHAEAQALVAARRKADGLHWRLPRVSDLRKLMTRTDGPRRSLDPTLFPAAPDGWHWALDAKLNTAQVNPYNYGNVVRGQTSPQTETLDVRLGWAVNPASGESRGDMPRITRLPVRLMRPRPPPSHPQRCQRPGGTTPALTLD